MKCHMCEIEEIEYEDKYCVDCFEWRGASKRLNKVTTLLNELDSDYEVEQIDNGYIIKVDDIIIIFYKAGGTHFKSREEFEK